MLFALRSDAVEVENWIGDWLDAALDRGFIDIDAGVEPNPLVGLSVDQTTSVKRRWALLKAFKDVLAKYEAMDIAARDLVRQAFDDQQRIPDLYEGHHAADIREILPASIRGPLDKLSQLAFGALTELGIRQASYDLHFANSEEGRTCAFCGYEKIIGPTVRSPDWDHYLARSLYPFASWKLRNLTPMGDSCNRNFKGSKDILRATGSRRACYDPYITPAPPTGVHLRHSDPIGTNGRPIWVVSIEGDPDRTATWDAAFRLKDRWGDLLDSTYRSCLRRLARGFPRDEQANIDSIRDRLSEEAELPEADAPGEDLIANAIFDMWNHHVAAGGATANQLFLNFQNTIAQSGSRRRV